MRPPSLDGGAKFPERLRQEGEAIAIAAKYMEDTL
jgi:hypothetical protein